MFWRVNAVCMFSVHCCILVFGKSWTHVWKIDEADDLAAWRVWQGGRGGGVSYRGIVIVILSSSSWIPSLVVTILYVFPYLIPIIILWGFFFYHYPYFADEETEAQSEVNYPSKSLVEPGFKPNLAQEFTFLARTLYSMSLLCKCLHLCLCLLTRVALHAGPQTRRAGREGRGGARRLPGGRCAKGGTLPRCLSWALWDE